MSYFTSYFGSYFSTGPDVDANLGWFPRLTDGHHTWFGGDAVAPDVGTAGGGVVKKQRPRISFADLAPSVTEAARRDTDDDVLMAIFL